MKKLREILDSFYQHLFSNLVYFLFLLSAFYIGFSFLSWARISIFINKNSDSFQTKLNVLLTQREVFSENIEKVELKDNWWGQRFAFVMKNSYFNKPYQLRLQTIQLIQKEIKSIFKDIEYEGISSWFFEKRGVPFTLLDILQNEVGGNSFLSGFWLSEK